MSGAHIMTVQQLLGHKDIKMTMRYSHLSSGFVQEAIDMLAQRYQLDTKKAQVENG